MSAAQNAGEASPQGPDRREVGNAESSQKHPPHLTVNDLEAAAEGGDAPTPALPANASGSDTTTGETGRHDGTVNPESAYEGRAEEDKDWSPGSAPRP